MLHIKSLNLYYLEVVQEVVVVLLQLKLDLFIVQLIKKIYLDLSFFDELAKRHDAPGDFAQAYVIAHEVGHHVQNLVGTLNKVQKAKQSFGNTKKIKCTSSKG